MVTPKSEPPRGVLNIREGSKHFQLSRYHPSPKLAHFVEHYWIVRWNLENQSPFRQDVLSHPNIHLVFSEEGVRIWGVVTGRFTRILEGEGKVLGVKFRAGGFYPFYRKPVAGFMDRQLPFSDLFEKEKPTALASDILKPQEEKAMAQRAETFLLQYLPERDPKIEELSNIVDTIQYDASIIKVDDISEQFKIGKRTLQRLFRKYVGVNPKWVIQRYWLHEAAEKMANGGAENWPDLALELGYYDQAHFIRDFKSVVGQTPADYAGTLRSGD